MNSCALAAVLLAVAGFAARAAEPVAKPTAAEEREVLRARVGELEAQVEELTVRLAEARLALDRLQVEQNLLPPAEGRADVAAGSEKPMLVFEASRELSLVVLEAGAAAGVKPGMVFAVLRGADVIARVRALEVREEISGARVEQLLGDRFPQRGDRVVLWRSSM